MRRMGRPPRRAVLEGRRERCETIMTARNTAINMAPTAEPDQAASRHQVDLGCLRCAACECAQMLACAMASWSGPAHRGSPELAMLLMRELEIGESKGSPCEVTFYCVDGRCECCCIGNE